MKINIVSILVIILLISSNIARAGLGYYTCGDGIEAQWKYAKFFLPKEAQPFTGKLCMYWENGQKSIESSVVDGVFSGKRTMWYRNGKKSAEKFFTKDAAIFKERSWYKSGKKKSVADYGKKDTGWSKNGQKSYEKNYSNGSIKKARGWYKNGQKEYEKNYSNGKLHGKSIKYWGNGQKKSEDNWKNGTVDVNFKYTEWDESGIIIYQSQLNK